MTEIQNRILDKVDKVEETITEIKITIAENSADLKHHIKRTDDLQDIVVELKTMVNPIYHAKIAADAVAKDRKKRREDFLYKLKLPGYIAAALVAVGTIITFFVSK